jgi:hypothetical protein
VEKKINVAYYLCSSTEIIIKTRLKYKFILDLFLIKIKTLFFEKKTSPLHPRIYYPGCRPPPATASLRGYGPRLLFFYFLAMRFPCILFFSAMR